MSFLFCIYFLTNSVMARVEACLFFIFCDIYITRGNMYRSCVTKSVLLLSECVPNVHVNVA